MVQGKRRVVRLLADEWTPYEDAYQQAVALFLRQMHVARNLSDDVRIQNLRRIELWQ